MKNTSKRDSSTVRKIKRFFRKIEQRSSLDGFDHFLIGFLVFVLVIVCVIVVATKFVKTSASVGDDEKVVQEYSHSNQFQLRTYGEDLTQNMENTEAPENELAPISVWGDSYCVSGNSTIPSLAAYVSKYTNRLVYNVSVPEDSLEMLAARQGGVPMYVSPCDIKREKSSVEITLHNQYGTNLLPSLSKNGGLNPCTINDIEGVLYELEGKIYFSRSASGNEEIVTDTTVPVVTKAMTMRRDDITIFFVGDDDIFSNTARTVEIYKKMTEYLTTDKYLVIGPVCGNTADVVKANKALEEAFGDKYYNLLDYLCTDAVTEYEFSLTDEEKEKVKNHELVPGYFLADGYFSNDVNNIAAMGITQKLVDLGYLN